MTASGTSNQSAIGFLTVVDGDEQGVFGGYLVLNTSGRPLEFHCTAPVKANRAQEILFGPTLKPFLYGEQIGRTLTQKSKLTPLFVVTDQSAVLTMRSLVKFPVALVAGETGAALPMDEHRSTLQLAGREIAVHGSFPADAETVREAYAQCDGHLDLAEPFGRIREAIEEARRGRRESRAA